MTLYDLGAVDMDYFQRCMKATTEGFMVSFEKVPCKGHAGIYPSTIRGLD